MKRVSCWLVGFLGLGMVAGAVEKPNVILMMADDLGWGDVGFNGGKIIQTPELDKMARKSLVFDRFYAAAPVCSPTRGSCLTGRHPYRFGVYTANTGHLLPRELTLAELMREQGYATGHFGKWHLGTLSPEYSGKGAGRKPEKNFMTPGMAGFDEWFSTEFAVATWNPYDPKSQHGKGKFDPRRLYWENGENVTEPQMGDDSRIIMDRAIPFIEKSVEEKKPFFTVIWFHAPHSPVVGGPEYRKRYAEYPEAAQHYYACVTALDEQVGRLRKKLRELGVADDTLLTFCSDNGPARQGDDEHVGLAGGLRGFKTSLWEGGVRVPGMIEWPARIKQGKRTDFPAVTSDYLPTVVELVGVEMPDDRPIDGISLVRVLDGADSKRGKAIGFQSRKSWALSGERFKLITNDKGKTWQLYDLLADRGEKKDLAAMHPERVAKMRLELEEWRVSCAKSDEGGDVK